MLFEYILFKKECDNKCIILKNMSDECECIHFGVNKKEYKCIRF